MYGRRVVKRRVGVKRRRVFGKRKKIRTLIPSIRGRGDYLIGNNIVGSERRKGGAYRNVLYDSLPSGSTLYVAPRRRYVGGRTLDKLAYGPTKKALYAAAASAVQPVTPYPSGDMTVAPPTYSPRDMFGLTSADWVKPYEPHPMARQIVNGMNRVMPSLAAAAGQVPGLAALQSAYNFVTGNIMPPAYQGEAVRNANLRRIMADSRYDRDL